MELENPTPPRRRKILIDSLQIKFAIYSLAIFLISSIAIWLEVKGAFENIYSLVGHENSSSSMNSQMSDALGFFTQILLFKLAAILLVIWAVSIFLSHKIVGPLYRLRACLKKVAEGDFSIRMNLRKGDSLQDVAQLFNEMMETVRKKVSK